MMKAPSQVRDIINDHITTEFRYMVHLAIMSLVLKLVFLKPNTLC